MQPIDAHRLCLLFTPAACAGDPWATLDAALAGGVDLVQWRVKTPAPAGLDRCLQICQARQVPVIVNDAVESAVAHAAAGAHVGQDDLPAAQARALLGPARWLGVSTHDPEQARAAVAAGADYLGIGPCFPTPTKGYTTGLDRRLLRAVLDLVRIPVFAIGGITPDNLLELRTLGVGRVAVSGCILAAADPERVAARLRAGLD